MSDHPETQEAAPLRTAPIKESQGQPNANPAGLQAHNTLGMEIFRSRNLSDIRNQLERKAITCRLIGGSDPLLMPVSIQLLDHGLRNAYHLAVITSDKPRLLTMQGATGDIIRHCWMDGAPPILATSPTPVWGQDDSDLLGAIAFIEQLESRALKGGGILL
jgi:hypothetical protein